MPAYFCKIFFKIKCWFFQNKELQMNFDKNYLSLLREKLSSTSFLVNQFLSSECMQKSILCQFFFPFLYPLRICRIKSRSFINHFTKFITNNSICLSAFSMGKTRYLFSTINLTCIANIERAHDEYKNDAFKQVLTSFSKYKSCSE